MSFYVFQRSIYVLFVIFGGDVVTCFNTHFILVYVVISVLTFFHDIYHLISSDLLHILFHLLSVLG